MSFSCSLWQLVLRCVCHGILVCNSGLLMAVLPVLAKAELLLVAAIISPTLLSLWYTTTITCTYMALVYWIHNHRMCALCKHFAGRLVKQRLSDHKLERPMSGPEQSLEMLQPSAVPWLKIVWRLWVDAVALLECGKHSMRRLVVWSTSSLTNSTTPSIMWAMPLYLSLSDYDYAKC